MAKLEKVLDGDFDQLLNKIVDGMQVGAMSATLEDFNDVCTSDVRCSVRVFERYSYAGGNRVSMNVTLFQEGDGPIYLTAIAFSLDEGAVLKFNTSGEDGFIEKLKKLL